MSQVYELRIDKGDKSEEVFYINGEDVFRVRSSRRLEQIFQPVFYSWNFREPGSTYFRRLDGNELKEAEKGIAEVK